MKFVETNIFNLVLFNLDAWVIYLAVYILCKIKNKGDEDNGR
jgi:hypothetical protein